MSSKSMKSQLQRVVPKERTVVCPYCNKNAKKVDGLSIYPHRPDLQHLVFWKCEPCDAYVGTHKNSGGVPLGTLADFKLRGARKNVHSALDLLWKTGTLSRAQAYKHLAKAMNLTAAKCHIGMFNIDQCDEALVILL